MYFDKTITNHESRSWFLVVKHYLLMHSVNYYEHAALHCFYSTVRQAMDTPFFNLRLISRLDRVHSLLGHKDGACPDCMHIYPLSESSVFGTA